jgi:phage shock protein C
MKGSALRGITSRQSLTILKLIMRKLYRTKIDKVFGGVCGGIGDYADIDPSLLRIIFICLIFSPFPIILTYILSWIIIPKQKF